jgi:hypothetical protein
MTSLIEPEGNPVPLSGTLHPIKTAPRGPVARHRVTVSEGTPPPVSLRDRLLERLLEVEAWPDNHHQKDSMVKLLTAFLDLDQDQQDHR